MKKIISVAALAVIVLAFFQVAPPLEAAEEITVSPTIIDEKAEARDILEYTVKIENPTEAKVELYPIVNDLDEAEGRQEFIDPSRLDKATSLARWVEITRGVIELGPGQAKEIPLKISVNLAALPGKYYAQIIFARGSSRPEAEKAAGELNQPRLAINVEIGEHVVERAEKNLFKAERNINLGGPVNFLLSVKNIGNKEIAPKGVLLVYDRDERQVSEIDVNRSGQAIGPEATSDFRLSWDSGGRIGRFKAKLELEYGSSDSRDLGDSIFFWVIPPWFIFSFTAALAVLVLSLSLLIARLLSHGRALHPAYGQARTAVIDLKSKVR